MVCDRVLFNWLPGLLPCSRITIQYNKYIYMYVFTYTHTHTHTHIYIYIYRYKITSQGRAAHLFTSHDSRILGVPRVTLGDPCLAQDSVQLQAVPLRPVCAIKILNGSQEAKRGETVLFNGLPGWLPCPRVTIMRRRVLD